MRKVVTRAACAVIVLALIGCAGNHPAEQTSDLTLLTEWLTGSFSSADQAARDPDNYYDIRLEMAPIWPDRSDGIWFYVEQAAASSLDQPYRQRVYRVTEPEPGLLASEVYSLPDPGASVGAWRSAEPLAGLAPEDLIPRTGCTVFLHRTAPDAFAGSTRDRDCGSELRGASYATSEITLTAGRLESWDRGWNEAGEQVWGAENGPYVFVKIMKGGFRAD